MKIIIISFTAKGYELSLRIRDSLKDDPETDTELYSKCSSENLPEEGSVIRVTESLFSWTEKHMEEKNAILFIGALGIAVRAIAPFVKDKLKDNPVIVIDELAKYVIPVLSGHVGGANQLAVMLGERTGAEPVITTATDINDRFAADIFAKNNDLFILNREGIALVSSKVLDGQNITVSVEPDHLSKEQDIPDGISIVPYPPQETTDIVISSEDEGLKALLLLSPKIYTIGIGVRKGKDPGEVEELFFRTIKEQGIKPHQISCIASIDIKRDEEGLVKLSRRLNVPFMTFSAGCLDALNGDFTASAYVKEITGVDNVCERAAMMAAGKDGRLILGKQILKGMTMAIAVKNWNIKF